MNPPNSVTTPRRKGKFRRILGRVVLLLLTLVAGFALSWVTGAQQDPLETGEPEMRAVIRTEYGSPDVLGSKRSEAGA